MGAGAIGVAVAAALWAALKPQGNGSDVHGLVYVVAVTVIAGILIFAWLVPARIGRGTGLPLAVLSVPLLLYAFWSGLCAILVRSGRDRCWRWRIEPVTARTAVARWPPSSSRRP